MKFGLGRNCGERKGRAAGLILMAAGLLILMLSVPSWLWSTVLGILLASIGFLVWRFC